MAFSVVPFGRPPFFFCRREEKVVACSRSSIPFQLPQLCHVLCHRQWIRRLLVGFWWSGNNDVLIWGWSYARKEFKFRQEKSGNGEDLPVYTSIAQSHFWGSKIRLQVCMQVFSSEMVPAQVTTTSRIKLRGSGLSWVHSKPNGALPRAMGFRRGSTTCDDSQATDKDWGF